MRPVWQAHMLAACTLLASCGDDSSKDTDKTEDNALNFSDVDAVIERFIEENDLAGATAVIVQRDKGQVHQRGYGQFDADRVHLIASGSKIISAGVLLALSDQGVLDLDAPISGILSSFGEHKP